jgi:hypothetical protein
MADLIFVAWLLIWEPWDAPTQIQPFLGHEDEAKPKCEQLAEALRQKNIKARCENQI